ncbi:MAG: hypothetical protein LT102_02505 [Burkholderiaceae bacterium]|nr:hypothetical protein [Burkholderiaceae bacterium]
MRWLKNLQQDRRPRRSVLFTLDRDGGLVVNRGVLVRSKRMDRQFKAADFLSGKKAGKVLVEPTSE